MDQNLIEAFRLQMQQRSGQDVGPTIAKHLPPGGILPQSTVPRTRGLLLDGRGCSHQLFLCRGPKKSEREIVSDLASSGMPRHEMALKLEHARANAF